MAVTTLDPKTALIVVDLQKGILSRVSADAISGVVKNAVALLDTFRKHNLLVVLVNVSGVAPGRNEQPRMPASFPG
ncbi:MAG: isochorismatase family protein [Rhizomicrobium sp.]